MSKQITKREDITTKDVGGFLNRLGDALVDGLEQAERNRRHSDVKMRNAMRVVDVLVSVGMNQRDAVRHVTWHLDRELGLSFSDRQRLEAIFNV